MERKLSAWSRFCGFLLHKVLGWKSIGEPAAEEKCIILGAPHTSIWDFVISYLYYVGKGHDPKCMVKSSLFFWPLGPILRAMGGVPVDRSNSTALVLSIIREMRKPGYFHLAIAPEGTRQPVKRWKAGFHPIAREGGLDKVYLAMFDWGTKRVGIFGTYTITDNAKYDIAEIQKLYEAQGLVGKTPSGYVTH
ncbi:MAG: 1-acyl-sn-glycerol-3-phosphate acyltransferase [Bacteroidales bacterium]|nr:1-acyl-sn-glycerol-3-phosphate acyltransferase [Bacteroidales bacterium]